MATANLTWDKTSGALTYTVEYKLQAEPVWILFNDNIPTASISIPNLLEGHPYDFKITTNCPDGNSQGIILSGETKCKDVYGLNIDFNGTTAELSWNKKPNVLSYEVEYKLQSSDLFIKAIDSPVNNMGQTDPIVFKIPGLSVGQAYEFKVTVNCLAGCSEGLLISGCLACINVGNPKVSFD